MISGPGAYSFPVGIGTYYLIALMDTNDNGFWDSGEPIGCAINRHIGNAIDAIIVNGSVDLLGVNITLIPSYQVSGTIYYTGNKTGMVGVGAYPEAHPLSNETPYSGDCCHQPVRT